MTDILANNNSTETILLSLLVSVVIALIAFGVFRSRLGTMDNLLLWYVILAGIMLVSVYFKCVLTAQPPYDDIRPCFRSIAPWLTLLAAHVLILLVVVEHGGSQKIQFPARANLLGGILIWAAAIFFVVAEHPLFVFLSIAIGTVPMLVIIKKPAQLKDTNEQIASMESEQ